MSVKENMIQNKKFVVECVLGVFCIVLLVGSMLFGWLGNRKMLNAANLQKTNLDSYNNAENFTNRVEGFSGITSKIRPINLMKGSNHDSFNKDKVKQVCKNKIPSVPYYLRDYHVMSSYNSCCSGEFQSNTVTLDALKNVIKQGVRLLDFEIFSLKNKPIVAVSDTEETYLKKSINHLELYDVLNTINNDCFKQSSCPNPKDPLFIHLRIKTKNRNIYDKIHSIMKENKSFYRKLLDDKYKKNGEITNAKIREATLEDLINHSRGEGKIVIICSDPNFKYEGTSFENDCMHIGNNNPLVSFLPDDKIINSFSPPTLTDSNKKNLSITYPNLNTGSVAENSKGSLHFKYGCQFICMNFWKFTDELQAYIKKFNTAGTAFILKDPSLRYCIVTINDPVKQDPKLSYAPRPKSEATHSYVL